LKISVKHIHQYDALAALAAWRDAARAFGARVPQCFAYRAFLQAIRDGRYLDVFLTLEGAQRRAGPGHTPIDIDADSAGQLWMLYYCEESAVSARPIFGVGIHLHARPDGSCLCSALYLNVTTSGVVGPRSDLCPRGADDQMLFRGMIDRVEDALDLERDELEHDGVEGCAAHLVRQLMPSLIPLVELVERNRTLC
jgi:hypothetical protein